MDHNNFEELEEEIERREREDRRKKEMPVAGRSIFQIKQILNQKSGHREKRK